MKRNILLYSLALASIVASCAKTDLPHFGGANDPNAVTISPSVALVSTRSNPLGDETAQEKFNPGDVITITDNDDNEVYTYKLESEGKWKPTDGKYLLWHDETLNISASYGESNITNVTDQSTAEGIAAADYMTFIGRVTRKPGSNELSFNMDRRRYLVIVIIDSYGDQYNHDDKVSGLKLSFEESGSSVEINPYVRDASGNNVSTDGTLGYSYSAICDVEYKTIKISYEVSGDKREAILSSFGGPDHGHSYTIKLRVGKDKIEVGDVTVGDWTDYAWEDVVTATKIPYLTFSAENEQKFKMDFYPAANPAPFGLGDGEYFEYSVGDGEWIRFTTTVSDIPFGGTLGDLRLRGKSSKGTAEGELFYSNISFTTDNVPVYCTGDIRTLIDYKAYQTVSTENAMFCNLFWMNSLLVTAPELPATDLADYCYLGMFQGCTSLTSAPVLPAKTLTTECYEVMFAGCTALSSVTMLATNVSAYNCLTDWLYNAGTGAASRTLTVASDAVYTAMVSRGYVPDLWKKADKYDINGKEIGAEATGLPYVTFSADSEQKFSMDFSGFNGGNFTLGEGEYFEYSVGGGNWVRFTGSISDVAFGGAGKDLRLRGKSSKGTANDAYSYSNIKFSTADVMVKCTGDIRTLIDYTDYTGVSTSSAKFCSLFQNNTLLTTAPELPALNLAENCYNSMFYGCSSLTEAPELLATNLTEGCYYYMFYSCSKLSKLTMLAKDVSANRCLENWLIDAGTSATSRTLTLANQDVYNSIESTLPYNWKSGQATIQYQNN